MAIDNDCTGPYDAISSQGDSLNYNSTGSYVAIIADNPPPGESRTRSNVHVLT